ncbi:hypothetical protein BHS10_01206 [Gardnerella vaginalis]|nr:hypothetical protein BHS10_01206 [Gardnerella vaginalis]
MDLTNPIMSFIYNDFPLLILALLAPFELIVSSYVVSSKSLLSKFLVLSRMVAQLLLHSISGIKDDIL